MDDSYDIPKYNIAITEDRIYDGAKELIKKIYPEWPLNELHFKIFTDGITNRLIGVYRTNKNEDMILIRVYGEKTDLFIDRQNEYQNMKVMNKFGLSAPIYCTFQNGICYGYTPGIVLDEQMVKDEHISKMIAINLAKMHNINKSNNPNQQKQACLFTDLKKFIALIDIDALPKHVLSNNSKLQTYCEIQLLQEEIDYLKQTLIKLKSPIVFCHNDLLLKNIIYNNIENMITFIDFEYSNYNYQAFDIANHFIEFCGLEKFNPILYPNVEFQKRWLKIYLEHFIKFKNEFGNMNNHEESIEVSDYDVDLLYEVVDKFTLASLLYWSTWAIVQSCNSSIDFDYIGMACDRLDEYFKRKQIILSNSSSKP